MNPISRQIPSRDPRMACKTSPAGPSFSIPLKMNPITQSKAGIGLTLGSVLPSHIAVYVLPFGKLVTQPAAKSVRRETSDLIDLGKVLAPHCEEEVAGDATLQRKSQLSPARGRPVNGSPSKTAACPRHVQ